MNTFIIIQMFLSLIILIIPFAFFYKLSKQKSNKQLLLLSLGYLICASPMINAVINDWVVDYADANIGLGLAFFLTWFLTGCLYVVLLIIGIVRFTKQSKAS